MKRIFFISQLLIFLGCSIQSPSSNETPPSTVKIDIPIIKVFDKVETNAITIKWSNIDKSESYTIYQSNDDKTFTEVSQTTDLFCRIADLQPETIYYYKVAATVNNKSINSKSVKAITSANLPELVIISDITTDKNGIITAYNSDVNKKSSKELTVLTLNLHTYQEKKQDEKFDLIVKTIAELDIDLIAFDECAQHKNTPFIKDSSTIRTDNMAYIITKRLKEYYNLDYDYRWDWAHYGWNVYEEGVAIVSKHKINDSSSRYVSISQTKTDINSRKIIYSSIEHPTFGLINFFSLHLHWRTSKTDESQNNQVIATRAFISEMISDNSADTSIVCGDYNSQANDISPYHEGYQTMINGGEYIDTFLVYNPTANNKPKQSEFDTVKGDFPGRIDYIFMHKDSPFTVISSQILFTPKILGVVTDHYGVLSRLKYK